MCQLYIYICNLFNSLQHDEIVKGKKCLRSFCDPFIIYLLIQTIHSCRVTITIKNMKDLQHFTLEN